MAINFYEDLTVYNHVYVEGGFYAGAAVDTNYDLKIKGASLLQSTLAVTGIVTLSSVANAASDPDKFLCISGSNQVEYRTGAEVLSDIGAVNGSGTANTVTMWSDADTLTDAPITISSNNVGIGTTSPGYKLAVEGAVAVQDAQNLWIKGGRIGYENTALDNAAYIYNIGAAGSSKLNIADTLYVVEAGNVGIGTTSPSKKLDVAGDWILDGINGGHFENYTFGSQLDISELTAGGWARANRIATSDSDAYVFSGVLGNDTTLTRAYWTIGSSSDATGYTYSNGIILLKNGNVGIGTTSPGNKLVVQSSFTTSSSNSFIEINSGHEASGGSDITGEAGLLFKQAGSGNVLRNAGSIVSGREGNYSTDSLADSYLTFSTAQNNVNAERMRITSGGNVGIGTTSPTEKLSLPDNAKIGLGDSADLQIYHNGSNSIIEDTGTGDLVVKFSNDLLIEGQDGANLINCNEGNSVQLYYNGSEKLETKSTGIEVTGDVLDRDIPCLFNSNFFDGTSSSIFVVPFNTLSESTVSNRTYYHNLTVPYAGKLVKVVMKNVSGSLGSGFTTQLFLYVNGSQQASSAELSISNSAVTWTPTSSNTFSAGDELSFAYQKSAAGTGITFAGVSFGVAIELTDYDI